MGTLATYLSRSFEAIGSVPDYPGSNLGQASSILDQTGSIPEHIVFIPDQTGSILDTGSISRIVRDCNKGPGDP